MEYNKAGEPKGFDPEHDISLSEALDLVMHMHPSAKPLTVRKFLIGIAIHENQTGLCGFAQRFEESYVRIDRPEPTLFRGAPEYFMGIPHDFWRIGMAIDENASGCFAANDLGHVTTVSVSDLPYRLRDMSNGDLQNERVELAQFAWCIHFPKPKLIALAEDPQWQAWGDVSLALQNRGKRGRPATWKWDEVKVALTIEAARNPRLLGRGSGPIREFINSEMRRLHYEQIPDRNDVDRYVNLFSDLWGGPPPDAPTN